MLVDFKGEPLIDEPRDQPFVRTGSLARRDLDAFREKQPAWRDADHFSVADGVGF